MNRVRLASGRLIADRALGSLWRLANGAHGADDMGIPSDGVPVFSESRTRQETENSSAARMVVAELPMAKESRAGEWGETWTARDVSNEGAVYRSTLSHNTR